MIKNIFFDLDDTLLDFKGAERESLAATLDLLGIPYTDADLSRYSEINQACWLKLEKKEYTIDEVLTNRFVIFFAELGIEADVARVREEYEGRLAGSALVVFGAVEALSELRGKYRLFVVSNGVSRSQYSRISRAGISEYFERIFISEDVGCEKPAKEFFERVLGALPDVLPEESVIVGDSMTSDIPAGCGAGIYTCLFNPSGKAVTGNITPDFEISELWQLEKIIKTIG